MKGKLIKTEQGWMVGTICYGGDIWSKLILLHPDDVKQMEQDALVFDNIDARIAAYPYVDFVYSRETIKINGLKKVKVYASLKSNENTNL